MRENIFDELYQYLAYLDYHISSGHYDDADDLAYLKSEYRKTSDTLDRLAKAIHEELLKTPLSD